jgi:bifunctional oligoribonuclease and PAP phosphatase NrnA
MERGVKNLEAFLSTHDKIAITTHESPDPDGIGAELAFYDLMIFLNKKPLIINSDKTPDKYLFMDPTNLITYYSDSYIFPEDIGEYSLVILDTNDHENIGSLHKAIFKLVKDVFIIDHHSRFETDIEVNYIDSTASSTSEMIYNIFFFYKMQLTYHAAMPMYAGILFDTGSFRYPKTSPRTHSTVSALVEAGVNPTWVFETIYESYSLSSLVLKSRMLATMEFFFDGRLVLMHLTPEMLIETGGIFSEGEHNINIPLSVKEVQASVLIKQDLNGPIKVSMRTKGDLNVADISFSHKGGGHKNAAGYKSYTTWTETKRIVLEDMATLFSN